MISEAYNEDCYKTLQRLESGSVDLLLQDTPFGVTQNEWDIKPDLQKMWPEWLRVGKENCPFIFFATLPFASELILSMPKLFRYDLIWEKSRATGFLSASSRPLRNHETILVFYKNQPTYNPQKWKGKPNHVKDGKITKSKTNNNYGAINQYIETSTENKHPVSVLYCPQQDPNSILHPTQKPLDLIRYLILTYSNEGDMVFDGYLGSGTTRVASYQERRNFIGAETSVDYFLQQEERFKMLQSKPELQFT